MTTELTFTITVDLADNTTTINPPAGYTAAQIQNYITNAAPGTLLVDGQVGNQITYTLLPNTGITVNSLAPVTINTPGDYVLSSAGTLSLGNTTVGGNLLILANGDVINGPGFTASNPAAVVGSLTIFSGGSIGEENNPLYVTVNNYVGTLQATGNIYFQQTSGGDLVLGNVAAGGDSVISAPAGNIVSLFPNTPTTYVGAPQASDQINVTGTLTLNAHGTLGTASQPFEVSLISGTLDVNTGALVSIQSPDTSLSFGNSTVGGAFDVTTSAGGIALSGTITAVDDVSLSATGGAVTFAPGMQLSASNGPVGVYGDSIVMDANSDVSAPAGQVTLQSTVGDVTIAQASSGYANPNAVHVISAGGIFGNGDGQTTFVATAIGGGVNLDAQTGIGGPQGPVSISAPLFQAISANGDITLTAADDDNATSITASNGAVSLTGLGALTFGTIIAQNEAMVTAPGNVTGSALISLNGTVSGHSDDTLSITTITGNGDVQATAGDTVEMGTTTSNTGSVQLTASTGDITGNMVNANQNATLNAGGSIIVPTITTTNGTVLLTAGGTVQVTTLSSAGDLDLNAGGSLSFGSLTSTKGDVSLGAGQDISIGTGEAQGSIDLTAVGSVNAGTLIADTGSVMANGAAVDTGSIQSRGSIYLTSGGDLTSSSALAFTGDLVFNAGNRIMSGDAEAYHDVSMTAGTSIDSNSTFALTGNVAMSALTVNTGSVMTDGNQLLAGEPLGGTGEAGFFSSQPESVLVDTARSLGLPTLQTAGSIYINAPGAFTTNSLVSLTGSVLVSAGGTVNAGQIASAIGDVVVFSDADIDVGSLTARGGAVLQAIGGINVNQLTTLQEGANLQAGGNIAIQNLITPAATLETPGSVLVNLGFVSNFFTVQAANIGANLTEPTGGASMLVMDLGGLNGTESGVLNLNVSNAQSIMFNSLRAQQASLNLSAPFVTIDAGQIGTELSLHTGQLDVLMDNADPTGQHGHDIQYYVPTKSFTMQLADLRATSSAFALDYRTGTTVHLTGEDAENSAQFAAGRAAYDTVHGTDLATNGPLTSGQRTSYAPKPNDPLVNWDKAVTPVNLIGPNIDTVTTTVQ